MACPSQFQPGRFRGALRTFAGLGTGIGGGLELVGGFATIGVAGTALASPEPFSKPLAAVGIVVGVGVAYLGAKDIYDGAGILGSGFDELLTGEGPSGTPFRPICGYIGPDSP